MTLLSAPENYFESEDAKKGNFKSTIEYGLDKLAKDRKGVQKFEGGSFPLLFTGLFFKPNIYCNDPDVIRDIMTVKNKLIDKDGF